MRETRCMSLLPRTTLHSDSEQLISSVTGLGYVVVLITSSAQVCRLVTCHPSALSIHLPAQLCLHSCCGHRRAATGAHGWVSATA
jgi:hypothetical protein